jgi:hypothetical protein
MSQLYISYILIDYNKIKYLKGLVKAVPNGASNGRFYHLEKLWDAIIIYYWMLGLQLQQNQLSWTPHTFL